MEDHRREGHGDKTIHNYLIKSGITSVQNCVISWWRHVEVIVF